MCRTMRLLVQKMLGYPANILSSHLQTNSGRLGLAPIKGPCHSSTERSPEIFCCPECFKVKIYSTVHITV